MYSSCSHSLTLLNKVPSATHHVPPTHILLLTTIALLRILVLLIIFRHLLHDLPSLLDIILVVAFTAISLHSISPSAIRLDRVLGAGTELRGYTRQLSSLTIRGEISLSPSEAGMFLMM